MVGTKYHIIPQLAGRIPLIYTTYSPCLLADYILVSPIPPPFSGNESKQLLIQPFAKPLALPLTDHSCERWQQCCLLCEMCCWPADTSFASHFRHPEGLRGIFYATNKKLDLLVVSNIFYFHSYLGKIPILTHIFQVGWNHQPAYWLVVGLGFVGLSSWWSNVFNEKTSIFFGSPLETKRMAWSGNRFFGCTTSCNFVVYSPTHVPGTPNGSSFLWLELNWMIPNHYIKQLGVSQTSIKIWLFRVPGHGMCFLLVGFDVSSDVEISMFENRF